MINRLPIKSLLTVLAVILVLWLVLSRSSNENAASISAKTGSGKNSPSLVSAIRPISDAEADSIDVGVASGSLELRTRQPASLNDTEVASLKSRFKSANADIERGQLQSATVALEAISSDFPSIIEPYLNLASIYVEQQQLEKAREVLLKGFAANPKAGMLFDHLKKVHGALAADSYRQALDTSTPDSSASRLSLARASNIVTQLDQSNQIAQLQKQLNDSRNQIESSGSQSQADKVLALEAKLDETEARKLATRAEFESQIRSLKNQLAEASQQLSLSQTAEREARARVVRAEQDAFNKVAEITKELESQKESLLAAQTLATERTDALNRAQRSQALARQEAEQARLANKPANLVSSGAASSENSDTGRQALEQNAIALVQSWARAWSAQDVGAYVTHYADDYSSSRSLSRQQWLSQRQIRLTNKEFINVNVSAFRVKDLGSEFTVTFSQYYQSNTVDDTVTKRLTFEKNKSDLRNSKIIQERLVSN